ncbi:MAG: DNA helicase RecQ [Phycisphaeraceae bacterium]|nr:DNA helicase RecQ [Phycisphaeraceae bacterium]
MTSALQPAAESLPSLLKRHFGHEDFRPLQEQAIRAALAGRDVFLLLPTGGGKSLCYQLPAVIRNGQGAVTVVISPLIALMHNQVDLLQANGIRATLLNSSITSREAGQRERDLLRGCYDLVYMAPERLMGPAGQRLLQRLNVAQVAIDEAHCISEWGHDFRPEYRMLGGLRVMFPDVPIMALTATATPRVARDIVEQLHLRDPELLRGDFERKNLHYEVRPKHRTFEQVLAYLRQRPTAEGIIYVASRAKAEDLAERLRQHEIAAVAYHAGMDHQTRTENQHAFIHGQARVCCATIAFGMGIDKPDVRFVMHVDLPRHLEGYYQETGRAGRDGLPADCILFFSPGDRQRVMYFIDQKPDEAERERAIKQLDQMIRYARHSHCRMVPLLGYFGETFVSPSGGCGHCDNCRSPRPMRDVTEDARKLLSAVARTQQRFGLPHVIRVLRGSMAEPVTQRGHDQLSVHGIGKAYATEYWRALAQHLIEHDQLALTDDEFRTTFLTPAGLAVLKGQTKVEAGLPQPAPSAGPEKRRKRSSAAAADLTADQQELFEKLRQLRLQIARQQGVPPYIVFGDTTLRHMAVIRPTSLDDFIQLPGVGQAKLERYAARFMELIQQAGEP